MKDKTGFTAISKFEVRNNMEDEVRQAFKNRPHIVDDALSGIASAFTQRE